MLPFIAASIALLTLLAALLASTRALRGRDERLSRGRQQRWRDALDEGSELELRALAERRRRRQTEGDLVSLLSTEELAGGRGELEHLRRAVAGTRLERALRRGVTSRRPERRAASALLLGALSVKDPTSAVEPLLYDKDRDVRAATARALAERSSPDAAHALLRGLRDGVLPAERLVERLGAPWAVEPLLRACDAEGYGSVRGWIAEALGAAGDSRAEAALSRVLRSSNEDERARACRALGRLSRRRTVPGLFDALRDPSWVVRAQAARAIAMSPDGRALPDLAVGLADPAWWVRANCAEALRQNGREGRAVLELVAGLHRDTFARERAEEALALTNAVESAP